MGDPDALASALIELLRGCPLAGRWTREAADAWWRAHAEELAACSEQDEVVDTSAEETGEWTPPA